jgi:hypothetical protein
MASSQRNDETTSEQTNTLPVNYYITEEKVPTAEELMNMPVNEQLLYIDHLKELAKELGM